MATMTDLKRFLRMVGFGAAVLVFLPLILLAFLGDMVLDEIENVDR